MHVQVRPDAFKLKPLHGLHISVTNYNLAQRMEAQQQVEGAGGKFSAELYKGQCTHLLVADASGKKYECVANVNAWATDHQLQHIPSSCTCLQCTKIAWLHVYRQTRHQQLAALLHACFQSSLWRQGATLCEYGASVVVFHHSVDGALTTSVLVQGCTHLGRHCAGDALVAPGQPRGGLPCR